MTYQDVFSGSAERDEDDEPTYKLTADGAMLALRIFKEYRDGDALEAIAGRRGMPVEAVQILIMMAEQCQLLDLMDDPQFADQI